jgi:hypothetical protein
VPELELRLRLPEGGQEEVAVTAAAEAQLPSRLAQALLPFQAPATAGVTSTLQQLAHDWLFGR